MNQPSRRNVLAGVAGVTLVPAMPRKLFAAGPRVFNETQGLEHPTLAEALSGALPNDTLIVDGRHVGNFVINRPLTLKSGVDGEIDGGGAGTVILIEAEDVSIESLTITGSGRMPAVDAHTAYWGPSGVRVQASRARLDGVNVTGNDWGIVLLGNDGSSILNCTVTDNQMSGVKLLGGRNHVITNNSVNGNADGISLFPRYGDDPSPMSMDFSSVTDVETMQEMIETASAMWMNPEGAEDVVVASNEVRGNAHFGIVLFTGSKRCAVEGNSVYLTGRERSYDPAFVQALSALLGQFTGSTVEVAGVRTDLDMSPMTEMGTGILLYCGTDDIIVSHNDSYDNAGRGLSLFWARTSRIENNRLYGNRSGMWLANSDDNLLRKNLIEDNAEYGLAIDFLMAPAALLNAAATNNLMVGNLLRGNAVNAYDSSDIVPTAEEFQRIFARFLFDTPGIAPGSPGSRGWMVQSYLSAFQPGMNRWDDGVHGNYYDDFDEPVEGFRDANRDGVGEAPRPIPGGRHVDRFPLSVERANSL